MVPSAHKKTFDALPNMECFEIVQSFDVIFSSGVIGAPPTLFMAAKR